MKNYLLPILIFFALFISCSTEDDANEEEITSIDIFLEDMNGDPVSDIVVYAYNESTWEVIGDETNFANYQAASDENGKATFKDISGATEFTSINNYQNTFRFSVNYNINGMEKNKVKPITFSLGDNKSETIILN